MLLVTADHGNAEMMRDPETGEPHTAHTTFDVPIIVVNADEPLETRPGTARRCRADAARSHGARKAERNGGSFADRKHKRVGGARAERDGFTSCSRFVAVPTAAACRRTSRNIGATITHAQSRDRTSAQHRVANRAPDCIDDLSGAVPARGGPYAEHDLAISGTARAKSTKSRPAVDERKRRSDAAQRRGRGPAPDN